MQFFKYRGTNEVFEGDYDSYGYCLGALSPRFVPSEFSILFVEEMKLKGFRMVEVLIPSAFQHEFRAYSVYYIDMLIKFERDYFILGFAYDNYYGGIPGIDEIVLTSGDSEINFLFRSLSNLFPELEHNFDDDEPHFVCLPYSRLPAFTAEEI